jgi:hypothetical protein
MCQYYKDRPSASVSKMNKNPTECTTQAPVLSEFDKLRESLLTDDAEGWASELRRYLGRMDRDVTKETDLVEWWQVRNSLRLIFLISHCNNISPIEQCTFISYPCSYRP